MGKIETLRMRWGCREELRRGFVGSEKEREVKRSLTHAHCWEAPSPAVPLVGSEDAALFHPTGKFWNMADSEPSSPQPESQAERACKKNRGICSQERRKRRSAPDQIRLVSLALEGGTSWLLDA